jgi:GntR family transcriptional regulator, transcriptional repressor for pyruvate dehydrogenase complex
VSEGLYEPIARRKTYELVEERLLGLISSGRIGPGDAMPSERELAQQYAVGRSSIREALRMLESKGVIRSSGGASFTVAEFGNALNHSLDFLLSVDQADFSELFEVRHMLEAEASGLAASRHVEADIGEMRRQIHAMEAGLGDEQEFIIADLRFHLAIAQATRNRLIVHLMHAIRAQLQRSLTRSFHVPGSPRHAIEMHHVILEAIVAREPEEARRRMHEHVSLVQDDATRHRTTAPKSS